MSILAKKQSLTRVIGAVIILMALLISLIIDFFILKNFLIYLYVIITIMPILFLVSCFKLEWNVLRNNPRQFFLIIIFYLILMIILGALIRSSDVDFPQIMFVITSNLLLIMCWHFSFSIYKNEKILFIVSGLGYIIITVLFKWVTVFTQLGFFVSIFPLFLIILGMCLIIGVEIQMKKKGLLNYL